MEYVKADRPPALTAGDTRGSVDYKRVPEVAGVDLGLYRSKAREDVRVTIQR